MQLRAKEQTAVQPVAAPVKKPRNAQELKLQAAIDKATGDTLFLSDTVFKQPVVISDSLQIDKDTLYIKAQGNLVLKRDTAYKGPAIVLSDKCKFIVIDDLQFQDFETGVKLTDNILILKSVQFDNCRIPVQKAFTFPDKKIITSYLPVTTFRADSVAKIIAKPTHTTKPANGAR